MSSTWTLKENSQGELKVKIAGDDWKAAQEKAFKKLAKKVEVKGFRKGQVPEAMARKAVAKQNILIEAVDEVAGKAMQDGMKEHDLWVIARPELKVDALSEDEVELTFVMSVKPEVTLGDYKGLEVAKEEVKVDDAEVEAQLTQLQEKFAELVVKEEGTVENTNTAVIDFEGFKDGVAFEGGKGENYPLEIGSGSFIPGFEEQLIGMSANETKDIDVTFPENYGVEDLAGAPVVFKVTVHEIKEKTLSEINDDLIKDAEIKDVETVEAFKEYTLKNLTAQKENDAARKFENDLLAKLMENSPVEIPEVMIKDETDSMVNDFAQRLAQQGFPMEQYLQMTGMSEDALREQMQPEAKSKVHVRLVLDAIANVENIEVSDKDA
ncbi:MAG: trigger factor, partial [Erysipelotrichia bacterium]|nr:trigger factor [Erysipelotrichia bacterium]